MIKKIALFLFFGAVSMFAASDADIVNYVSNALKANKAVTIKSVKVTGREAIEGMNGWESVKVIIDANVDRGNGQVQNLKTSDMFFVKGDFLATDLINLKKNKTLKEICRPKITNDYYDSEHLVAGNKDAKQKIVVFSDPLCPFCRDLVPDIINTAVKNPTKLAVYHYSYPLLTLHPSSEKIVKAEISLRGKIKNKAEFLTKLYKTDVEPNEQNEDKIIERLNAELGTKIQKGDVNSKSTLKEYEAELEKAYKMMIKGTPSIFVNGEMDTDKSKINQILKDLK
jgi:thiol:disulfide interchange protein DsbC